jgi:hypothetical protein
MRCTELGLTLYKNIPLFFIFIFNLLFINTTFFLSSFYTLLSFTFYDLLFFIKKKKRKTKKILLQMSVHLEKKVGYYYL